MNTKRVAEWAGSVEGLFKILLALATAVGALGGLMKGWLAPFATALGLPDVTATVVVSLLAIVLAIWLVLGYRRFAAQSRLELPDRFTLMATTPEGLIGRADDLARLRSAVDQNRIVLLDGESGCGKSALVAAGLVPHLRASTGLLPLLVRDWGDDWVRGPLAATLDALYAVLSETERESVGWTEAPDLAAETATLTSELDARLQAVRATLRRRPRLIADQFDDYQAQHRPLFLDAEGNWLRPNDLDAANPFWGLVQRRLRDGTLHLLAVTRADTASGLSCLRFLDDRTVDRPLPRVEVDYLRPMLVGIAPDGAQPPVVSNPAGGWTDLRDRLEADLRAQGAILMQQVRTLLLGLRQLPVLTPAAYRRAGELRGVEMLVIARALERAGGRVGGGAAGLRAARRVLGALVLPGGPDQAPKAQRRSLPELAGDARSAAAMLEVLQAADIVRPADGMGREHAWHLDHDYLARAVLVEARQSDRWTVALREGLARYNEATGSWRARWAALLPISTQARLVWERTLGRLRYGDAANYARLSAVKPLLLASCLGLLGWGAQVWIDDRRLTNEAQSIYDRFRTTEESEAVLEIWRAPALLRGRLLTFLRASPARLDTALLTNWPLAQSGLEQNLLLQMTGLLQARLGTVRDSEVASGLSQSYAAVAARLTDPAAVLAATTALRARLGAATSAFSAYSLGQSYAVVAARLTHPAAVLVEATALRAQLEAATDTSAHGFARAYAAVAAKLADPAAVLAATTALRTQLETTTDTQLAEDVARAYARVAERALALPDPIGARSSKPGVIRDLIIMLGHPFLSRGDTEFWLRLFDLSRVGILPMTQWQQWHGGLIPSAATWRRFVRRPYLFDEARLRLYPLSGQIRSSWLGFVPQDHV